MYLSSVSGSRSQNFQFRRSRSTISSSCCTVTSAFSGQTFTQMLHPLHASGFTVMASSPPEPFSFDSGRSKNGAVLASGNSAKTRIDPSPFLVELSATLGVPAQLLDDVGVGLRRGLAERLERHALQ